LTPASSAITGISNSALVALAKGGLGRCLLARQRYQEAEPLLLASYQAFGATPPGERYYRERLRRALVTLYGATGRAEQARAF